MLKIYVAGKNLERAKAIMNVLEENGYVIIFDWVKDINDEKDPIKKAQEERKAVQESDILVYLWESDQESARYEAGMAMGLNKPIIVSGFNKKLPFFLSLPEVVSVSSDDEILSALEKLK